jgi:ATP-dependent RNA helicase SUPV3L1/SUV3
VRKAQAQLFNEEGSGYDVLVASDAVGLGLNLNIKRIVFYSLNKFDGVKDRALTVSETLQVAGRAGRFRSRWPEGYATTFHSEHAGALRRYLKGKVPPKHKARLFLPPSALVRLKEEFPQVPLADLLLDIMHNARCDNLYEVSDSHSMAEVAAHLEPLDLSAWELVLFSSAPVSTRKPLCINSLVEFGTQYRDDRNVTLTFIETHFEPLLRSLQNENTVLVLTPRKLNEMETLHDCLDLYLWLARRLGEDMFPGLATAELLRDRVVDVLEEALKRCRLTPQSVMFFLVSALI